MNQYLCHVEKFLFISGTTLCLEVFFSGASAFLLTVFTEYLSNLLSSTCLWKVSGGSLVEYLKCHITEVSDTISNPCDE